MLPSIVAVWITADDEWFSNSNWAWWMFHFVSRQWRRQNIWIWRHAKGSQEQEYFALLGVLIRRTTVLDETVIVPFFFFFLPPSAWAVTWNRCTLVCSKTEILHPTSIYIFLAVIMRRFFVFRRQNVIYSYSLHFFFFSESPNYNQARFSARLHLRAIRVMRKKSSRRAVNETQIIPRNTGRSRNWSSTFG